MKITVPAIRARKGAGRPIVALTAYDYPTARTLDAAGVDLILVGDSLGMVVLGHPTTLPVTLEVMLHHTAAVARAKTAALVVADMPFLSYHVSREETIRNAGRLVQEAGAEAVKIEGGRARAGVVRALVEADIQVMGHIGLTPQSVHAMGGYKVQGKSPDAVQSLLEDARALEEAGAFSIVLEGIPGEAARLVTQSTALPTIGIGAGPHCDGQILVVNDLLGLNGEDVPRFVRRYADLRTAAVEAVRAYAADVAAGRFPAEEESYGPGPRGSKAPEATARAARPAGPREPLDGGGER
ncbi:MAG: 3-methyl-2-oxobutanoate hydroxymethyltransferase [Acidobacteria bacterium]|nr:3-methyl-2-oxobutanoate hydroxymethyltransferase [Acidobacteriota bacterium]